jgi:hypothetical protein
MLPKNSQQGEALGGIARVCPSCFRTYTTIEVTKLLLDGKEGLNCYSKRGCEGPYIRSDTLVKPGVVSDGLVTDSSSFQALDGVYVNGSFFTGGNPLASFDSPMLSAFNTTFVKVKPTTLGMPIMLNGIWLRMKLEFEAPRRDKRTVRYGSRGRRIAYTHCLELRVEYRSGNLLQHGADEGRCSYFPNPDKWSKCDGL